MISQAVPPRSELQKDRKSARNKPASNMMFCKKTTNKVLITKVVFLLCSVLLPLVIGFLVGSVSCFFSNLEKNDCFSRKFSLCWYSAKDSTTIFSGMYSIFIGFQRRFFNLRYVLFLTILCYDLSN